MIAPIGPSAIARADAASGRCPRQVHGFRDGLYCDLCCAGPFSGPNQQREHEYRGRKHERAFRRYRTFHREEVDRIQEEEASKRMEEERARRERLAGRHFIGCTSFAEHYRSSPFWCGDLSNLKASLYDVMNDNTELNRANADASYKQHVLRIQAELLTLSCVRVRLLATFGSMDDYRAQGAVHDQLGLANTASQTMWKQSLAAAAEPAWQVVTLVKPWI